MGPSVAPFRLHRSHLVVQENNFFSFEYMVRTNLAERPGFPVSINIEGTTLSPAAVSNNCIPRTSASF